MEENIENKKDSGEKLAQGHKLYFGVGLAILVATVLVGGSTYYLMKKEYTGRAEKILVQLKNEKEITKEYKMEKETCEKENVELKLKLPSGKYTSIDNVIEFNYLKSLENPLYEKNGIIQFLWPLKTAQSNPLNFPKYQTISVNEEKYVLKPFLEGFDEGIMIIEKEEQEMLEDAIRKLIKEQGKDPNDCKIAKRQDGEKEIAWIELVQEYKPTEEDLISTNLPEETTLTIKESFSIGTRTREICSTFSSAGGPGLSFFEYDSNKTKTSFIFKQASGYDSSINFSSVNFLDQE